MQLLYWTDRHEGKLNGTLQCKDGHVHLIGVPGSRQQEAEDMIRIYADSRQALPPSIEETAAYLSDICVKVDHGPHVAFSLNGTANAGQAKLSGKTNDKGTSADKPKAAKPRAPKKAGEGKPKAAKPKKEKAVEQPKQDSGTTPPSDPPVENPPQS